MTHTPEIIQQLAKEFSAIIRRDLEQNELEQVIETNRLEPQYCASHDFIDSNMSMAEAFTIVLGRDFIFFDDEKPETEAQNATDTDAMNKAWALAKENDFFTQPTLSTSDAI